MAGKDGPSCLSREGKHASEIAINVPAEKAASNSKARNESIYYLGQMQ
jgi:hypothetical protein